MNNNKDVESAKKLTAEQLKEAIKVLESQLASLQEESEDAAYSQEENAKVKKEENEEVKTESKNKEKTEIQEEEWLPADDLSESADEIHETDISTPISGYPANTVGALIAVLKRSCNMTDLLLPRINPGKKELMVFDIYSSNGRAVIDLVEGRVDDPAEI